MAYPATVILPSAIILLAGGYIKRFANFHITSKLLFPAVQPDNKILVKGWRAELMQSLQYSGTMICAMIDHVK